MSAIASAHQVISATTFCAKARFDSTRTVPLPSKQGLTPQLLVPMVPTLADYYVTLFVGANFVDHQQVRVGSKLA